MQLSDEATQKLTESCRAIQIILLLSAISSVIYLGVVFSAFDGLILLNKQPHRESPPRGVGLIQPNRKGHNALLRLLLKLYGPVGVTGVEPHGFHVG